MGEKAKSESHLAFKHRIGSALRLWGKHPPGDYLDQDQWTCAVCDGQRNWGSGSSYRWPEGLHRCVTGCEAGWHFVCLPCITAFDMVEDCDGLTLYLLVCPDGLRVAEALMGRVKPDCETCQDEGITEIGGTEIGEPAEMVACGECAAGERVLEESRP